VRDLEARNPDPGPIHEEKPMISKLLSLALAAALTALAGCNTMKGLGEDIERGGEKLQGAAERAQD